MPQQQHAVHASEIPLSRPDISEMEVELVTRTLRSGRLALGPMAEQFEKQVAAHGRTVTEEREEALEEAHSGFIRRGCRLPASMSRRYTLVVNTSA